MDVNRQARIAGLVGICITSAAQGASLIRGENEIAKGDEICNTCTPHH